MSFLEKTEKFSVGDILTYQIGNQTDTLKILAIFPPRSPILDGIFPLIVPACKKLLGERDLSKYVSGLYWHAFVKSPYYKGEDSKMLYLIDSDSNCIKYFSPGVLKLISNLIPIKCACGKECKPTDNDECYDCWNKKHQLKFL